jgi:hypothetical protein
MFNKYQNIFRSRWRAVIWGLGVCLTAYCTVPSAQQTAAEQAAQAPRHVNPWARDTQG